MKELYYCYVDACYTQNYSIKYSVKLLIKSKLISRKSLSKIEAKLIIGNSLL